jgi:hypothetical protein
MSQTAKTKLLSIEKKTDKHSLKSADRLKIIIEKYIKSVFVGALKCVEIKFGKQFDGHDVIRREVLRLGNDAIRELHEIIDNHYNVEELPDVLTITPTLFGSKGKRNGEDNEKK